VSNGNQRPDRFPIRVIEELTGVPATTLRAWERRYGVLKPERSESGHRLYNGRDLDKVRDVVRLLAANLPIREAARMVKEGQTIQLPQAESDGPWDPLRRRLLKAIEGFDEGRVDALYNEAISLYPMDLITDHLLKPTLARLGERWKEREEGIAEEHFFTAWLRNKLGARLHHESQRPRGRRLLAACLPGEYHELGLLLFVLAAMGRGYRALYLGPDLPLNQIPGVVKRTGAAGVVLSGQRFDNPALEAELRLLAEISNVPLFLGGEVPDGWGEKVEGVHRLGGAVGPALATLEGLLPAHGRPDVV